MFKFLQALGIGFLDFSRNPESFGEIETCDTNHHDHQQHLAETLEVADQKGTIKLKKSEDPQKDGSTGVGGSTWEVFLEHAVAAITAGQAEVVLIVYGSTARSDLKKGLRSANLALSSRGPMQ